MTGTSTQIMIDVADLATGRLTSEARSVVLPRLRAMAVAVASFALGCAIAALAFIRFEMKVFLLPPLIVALSLLAVVEARRKSAPAQPM